MKRANGLFTKMAGLLAVISLPLHAHAAYFCVGPVELVAVDPSGRVGFRSPSWTQNSISVLWVCQVGGTYNGISSETCKGLLSTLLTAKTTGATTVWAFNDSLSCTIQPTAC